MRFGVVLPNMNEKAIYTPSWRIYGHGWVFLKVTQKYLNEFGVGVEGF
jgi:hypothetical protein